MESPQESLTSAGGSDLEGRTEHEPCSSQASRQVDPDPGWHSGLRKGLWGPPCVVLHECASAPAKHWLLSAPLPACLAFPSVHSVCPLPWSLTYSYVFFSVFSSLQFEAAIMAMIHLCFSCASLQACFHWFRLDPCHIHYFQLLRVGESGLLKFMGRAKSIDRLFSDEVPTFFFPPRPVCLLLLLFLYDLR